MTDHKQNANEVGVQKLVVEGLLEQEWYDGYREEVVRRTLNAMLPHLRAMIAQEILDEEARHNALPECIGEDPYARYSAGLRDAAQIAKGPQQ